MAITASEWRAPYLDSMGGGGETVTARRATRGSREHSQIPAAPSRADGLQSEGPPPLPLPPQARPRLGGGRGRAPDPFAPLPRRARPRRLGLLQVERGMAW